MKPSIKKQKQTPTKTEHPPTRQHPYEQYAHERP